MAQRLRLRFQCIGGEKNIIGCFVGAECERLSAAPPAAFCRAQTFGSRWEAIASKQKEKKPESVAPNRVPHVSGLGRIFHGTFQLARFKAISRVTQRRYFGITAVIDHSIHLGSALKPGGKRGRESVCLCCCISPVRVALGTDVRAGASRLPVRLVHTPLKRAINRKIEVSLRAV